MRVEGERIETQKIYVLTRTKPHDFDSLLNPAVQTDDLGLEGPVERALVRWNGFDHAAPPGQTVNGTVRDEATKKSIPGAIIESYLVAGSQLAGNASYKTIADANGHYRLSGLPRAEGNANPRSPAA